MEKMTVIEPFTEYEDEGKTRVDRVKGEELNVTNERADQLRERGFARKKPASAGKPETDEDPGTADPA